MTGVAQTRTTRRGPPAAEPLGAGPLGAGPLGAGPLGATSLGATPLGGDRCRFSVWAPDHDTVRVEISDTGPGIPNELRTAIFTRPMFSSAGGRSGGLGLVIVQRILQLHGSDIRLLPRPEKGAVFSFLLT